MTNLISLTKKQFINLNKLLLQSNAKITFSNICKGSIFVLTFLLSSCATNEVEKVKPTTIQYGGREEKSYVMPIVSEGRLVFKSFDDLKIFNQYAFANNPAIQDEWEKKAGFISIKRYTTENIETTNLLNTLPLSMIRVLNHNAELQVNDKILWFNRGIIYTIDKKDIESIAAFKQQPDSNKATGTFFSEEIGTNAGITTDINLGVGQGDARYQKEYGLDNDGGSRRKIVYEIKYDFVRTGLGYSASTIVTNLKMEYRGRCGIFSNPCWRPAGESRTVGFNANAMGSIKFKKFGIVVGTAYINAGNSYQGVVNYDVQDAIAVDYNDYPGATPEFDGTVQGYYSTTVNTPNHSQGFYNLTCIW